MCLEGGGWGGGGIDVRRCSQAAGHDLLSARDLASSTKL